MRLHTVVGIVVSGLVLGLFGCSSTTTTAPMQSPTETGAPSVPVELKVVTGAEWDKVIQSHKGKVIVVDVWAMTCDPCKKHFHEFLALSKKYPKEGVICISLGVSMVPDEPVDQPASLDFLKSKNSTVPNYCYEDKKPYTEQFKIGALPVCWVYGKDGQIAKTFQNDKDKTFTYAQVEEEVKAQQGKP